jgi:hypothetical protein
MFNEKKRRCEGSVAKRYHPTVFAYFVEETRAAAAALFTPGLRNAGFPDL